MIELSKTPSNSNLFSNSPTSLSKASIFEYLRAMLLLPQVNLENNLELEYLLVIQSLVYFYATKF